MVAAQVLATARAASVQEQAPVSADASRTEGSAATATAPACPEPRDADTQQAALSVDENSHPDIDDDYIPPHEQSVNGIRITPADIRDALTALGDDVYDTEFRTGRISKRDTYRMAARRLRQVLALDPDYARYRVAIERPAPRKGQPS